MLSSCGVFRTSVRAWKSSARASRLTQGALWALLLALPGTAIFGLGNEGHPLTLLGGVQVVQIPVIAASGLASLTDWGEVHKLIGDGIIWLAGLYAVAAIYHHVVRRGGVLLAMLPSGWPH